MRYHGDFDRAGIAIAQRLIARGARPWRLAAGDYRQAVSIASGGILELTGPVGSVSWDAELAGTMNAVGLAVHEEALLKLLLGDLRAAPPAS